MSATLLRIVAVIALAAILPWLAHAAPSLGHGPETDARFLERCADDIIAARRPGPMAVAGRPRF